MNAIHALIFAALAGTAAGPSDRPATFDPAARARELVKDLADPKYRVREAAERELLRLGSASIDALKQGESHPDPHVQERCKALQPAVRELELRQKIDAFIAGQGNSKGIPLADKFLAAAGDSKESRTLFGEVLAQSSTIFDALASDRKKATELFVARCQEAVTRNQRVVFVNGQAQGTHYKFTRADVAAYLLLCSELKDNTGRASAAGWLYLQAPSLAESLGKNTAEAAPLKKLFLYWLEKEPQPHMVEQGLQVAVNVGMKEALPLLLKQVTSKQVPIHSRAQTALLLAKVGDKEHLKEIEPLLQDKTVVGNFGINNKQGSVQMRDIALAVSVKLRGQKMADYDFDVMKGSEDLVHMSYVYCAFSSDAKREAAHKKYREAVEKEAKK